MFHSAIPSGEHELILTQHILSHWIGRTCMVFSSSRNLKTFCCVPLQFQIELQGTGPSCPLGISDRRRQWHPTPALLPGKSHGRRILVGCSPWGCYESDTTERLHFHFSLSCIGEGNGNPLQCSCLENPRDEGAWWAAISGSHRVGHD